MVPTFLLLTPAKVVLADNSAQCQPIITAANSYDSDTTYDFDGNVQNFITAVGTDCTQPATINCNLLGADEGIFFATVGYTNDGSDPDLSTIYSDVTALCPGQAANWNPIYGVVNDVETANGESGFQQLVLANCSSNDQPILSSTPLDSWFQKTVTKPTQPLGDGSSTIVDCSQVLIPILQKSLATDYQTLVQAYVILKNNDAKDAQLDYKSFATNLLMAASFFSVADNADEPPLLDASGHLTSAGQDYYLAISNLRSKMNLEISELFKMLAVTQFTPSPSATWLDGLKLDSSASIQSYSNLDTVFAQGSNLPWESVKPGGNYSQLRPFVLDYAKFYGANGAYSGKYDSMYSTLVANQGVWPCGSSSWFSSLSRGDPLNAMYFICSLMVNVNFLVRGLLYSATYLLSTQANIIPGSYSTNLSTKDPETGADNQLLGAGFSGGSDFSLPVQQVVVNPDVNSIGHLVASAYNGVLRLIDFFLILIFIAIAIANILQIQINNFSLKKILPGLLIGFLAAHFSLFFIRSGMEIVDELGTQVVSIGTASSSYNGFIDAFSSVPFRDVDVKGGCAKTSAYLTLNCSGNGPDYEKMFKYLINMTFTFSGAFLVLAMGLVFMARRLIFFFMIPLAPLAMLGLGFTPMSFIWQRWWKTFSGWLFMPLISAFFIWLAFVWFGAITPSGVGTTGSTAYGGGVVASLFSYTFGVIALLMALRTPFTMAGEAKPIFDKWGQALNNVGRSAWNNTGRKVADKAGWSAALRFANDRKARTDADEKARLAGPVIREKLTRNQKKLREKITELNQVIEPYEKKQKREQELRNQIKGEKDRQKRAGLVNERRRLRNELSRDKNTYADSAKRAKEMQETLNHLQPRGAWINNRIAGGRIRTQREVDFFTGQGHFVDERAEELLEEHDKGGLWGSGFGGGRSYRETIQQIDQYSTIAKEMADTLKNITKTLRQEDKQMQVEFNHARAHRLTEEAHANLSDWHMPAPPKVREAMAAVEQSKDILAEDEQILKNDVRRIKNENSKYTGELIGMKKKVVDKTLEAENSESERYKQIFKEIDGHENYVSKKLMTQVAINDRSKQAEKAMNRLGVTEHAVFEGGKSLEDGQELELRLREEEAESQAEEERVNRELTHNQERLKEEQESLKEMNKEHQVELKKATDAGDVELQTSLKSSFELKKKAAANSIDSLTKTVEGKVKELGEVQHNRATIGTRYESLYRQMGMHAEAMEKRDGASYGKVSEHVKEWLSNEKVAERKVAEEQHMQAFLTENPAATQQQKNEARKAFQATQFQAMQDVIKEAHSSHFGVDFVHDDKRYQETYKRLKAIAMPYINEESRDQVQNKEYFKFILDKPEMFERLQIGDVGSLTKNERGGYQAILQQYHRNVLEKEGVDGMRKAYNALREEKTGNSEEAKRRQNFHAQMKNAFHVENVQDGFDILEKHLREYTEAPSATAKNVARTQFLNKYNLAAINLDAGSADPNVIQNIRMARISVANPDYASNGAQKATQNRRGNDDDEDNAVADDEEEGRASR